MDNAHEFFNSEAKNTDHFVIEDLLDLPNDDSTMVVAQGGAGGYVEAGATTSTAGEDYNSTAEEPNYSSFMESELCVPYDDLAELEWHIAEDYSFSNDEFQKLQLIQGLKSSSASSTQLCHFQPDNPVPVPAKARSKRSRAASGSWTSRLLTAALPDVKSSEQLEEFVVRKPDVAPKNSEARRCQHCSAEKTPQWRTGPMGPKTLCNACGVRYKSGRLVPEYRPAASPTFVLTKHSNSHRKVLELRRQKEMIRVQQQHQFLQHNHIFDHHHHHHHVGNGEDYIMHPRSIETASYDHMMI